MSSQVHRELAALALERGLIEPETLRSTRWSIAERYEVLGLIGQGAAGTVFRVLDPRLEREVALKLMDGAGQKDPARFLQEIRVLAKLEHPGVVTIYDADMHQGAPFYVMELATHGTLADADLPLEDWVRALAEVSRAAGAAHGEGIVHRDLKAENVLMVRGHPKLADFGVAKHVGDLETAGPGLTKVGAMVGTPYTMAPEQLGDGGISPATDVHALGVMLFERLCGVPPFPRDSGIIPLSAAILDDDRPSPLDHDPQVDSGLAAIAGQAIARDPAARYQDGAALADALDAWLEAPPWWQTPPVLAGAAAAAAVLLLLLLALLRPASTDQPPAPVTLEPSAPAFESPESSPSERPVSSPPEPPSQAPLQVELPLPQGRRLQPSDLGPIAAALGPSTSDAALLELSACLRLETVTALLDDPGTRLLLVSRPDWEQALGPLRQALDDLRAGSVAARPSLEFAWSASTLLTKRYVDVKGIAETRTDLERLPQTELESALLTATLALIGFRTAGEVKALGIRSAKMSEYETLYGEASERARELGATDELSPLTETFETLRERLR